MSANEVGGEVARDDHAYWAAVCTCGMDEQERTGHYPEHEGWCDVPSPLDDEDDEPFDRRLMQIMRRSDGCPSGEPMDVTNWSPRDLDRLFDGLVRKVDFETWTILYTPVRGEDQTLEDWARVTTPAASSGAGA